MQTSNGWKLCVRMSYFIYEKIPLKYSHLSGGSLIKGAWILHCFSWNWLVLSAFVLQRLRTKQTSPRFFWILRLGHQGPGVGVRAVAMATIYISVFFLCFFSQGWQKMDYYYYNYNYYCYWDWIREQKMKKKKNNKRPGISWVFYELWTFCYFLGFIIFL